MKEKQNEIQQNWREAEKEKDKKKFNLKRAKEQRDSRFKRLDTVYKRKRAFSEAIRDGRTYLCISCHRKLFKNGVTALKENWIELQQRQYPSYIKNCIGKIIRIKLPRPVKHGSADCQDIDYICHTCSYYMDKGTMAPMSNQNNLQLVDKSQYPELNLKEVENQLVAPNLIFQKIKLLPKSRWNAMVDKTVNVPIPLEEISHTIDQLPRRPSDACIIPVQLKRMKKYKNAHKQEYIDCHKIVKAIETMKKLENPYYKDIQLDAKKYFEECKQTSDGDSPPANLGVFINGE